MSSVRESRKKCPHCGARPRGDRHEAHVEACASDPNPLDIGWREVLAFPVLVAFVAFVRVVKWAEQIGQTDA